MDHVVYLDAKSGEMAKIFNHEKTLIIRGATGRKIPYGRVNEKDVLYLIENDGSGLVKGKATVKSVINSEKMSQEESASLVEKFQAQLALTPKQFKRWAGKRYLVLIEIDDPKELPPFPIDKSGFGNMDDWLPVEKIENVTLEK